MRMIRLSLLILGLGAAPAHAVIKKLPTVTPTYWEDELAKQVQRMIDAGHLAPGLAYVSDHYCFDAYPAGTTSAYYEFDDYWHNPAETVYTLAIALPLLPQAMQEATRTYLKSEFAKYPPTKYIHTGPEGARRELAALPLTGGGSSPEDYFQMDGPRERAETNNVPMKGWEFDPFNFYACWKYAQAFPAESKQLAADILKEMRSKLPPLPTDETYLQERPHILNGLIAGYYGFLGLQDLAQEARTAAVEDQLAQALQKRLSHLTAVDPVKLDGWEQGGFLYLVPEAADHLAQNAAARLKEVWDYWNWAQPYWHIPVMGESLVHLDKADHVNGYVEGAAQDVYSHWGLFHLAAHGLKWSREKLERYLHGGAVHRGDLYYIQNIVATILAKEGAEPIEYSDAGLPGDGGVTPPLSDGAGSGDGGPANGKNNLSGGCSCEVSPAADASSVLPLAGLVFLIFCLRCRRPGRILPAAHR